MEIVGYHKYRELSIYTHDLHPVCMELKTKGEPPKKKLFMQRMNGKQVFRIFYPATWFKRHSGTHRHFLPASLGLIAFYQLNQDETFRKQIDTILISHRI